MRVLWNIIWYPCALTFALLCLLIPIPGWIILAIWHTSDKRRQEHRELMTVMRR